MDRPEIDWSIILKKISNELSAEEQQQFENWLNDSPANQEYYERAAHYFNRYQAGETDRQVDMEKAWGEFVHHGKPQRTLVYRWVASVAASVLLVLGALFYYNSTMKEPLDQGSGMSKVITYGTQKALLLLSTGEEFSLTDSTKFQEIVHHLTLADSLSLTAETSSEEQEVPVHTVIVPRGGEFRFHLPDGTEVTLNADSRLSFPASFSVDSVRRVTLKGEAYFDVKSDHRHPFVVYTTEGEVRVLGTKFNVSAYDDEPLFQTALVEGKVILELPQGNVNEVLTPGMLLSMNKESGQVIKKKVNTNIYTAWTEGKWIIEGQDLKTIMKQISRWYNVEVTYADPKIKDLRFTGDLERYGEIETLLDIITLTTDVKFTIIGRELIVSRK